MKTANRLKFLRIAICAGFLAGIFGSFELWFSLTRTFPRAPLFFELPEKLVVSFERFLTLPLVVSLVSLIFGKRRKIFFAIGGAALILLIFLDQTRLQPWVYQYFLILFVLAWQTENENASVQTLALVQVLIAALYFWSGLQKMNYAFAHETLPMLFAPLQNLFPSVQFPFVFLGIAVALIEIFVGVGLLFKKTRNAAVCLAVVTHLLILALLIAKNYNQIVWIWNAALVALVLIAFWRSDVSVWQMIREKSRLKIAKTIVAAAVLLPVLSFFGLWDMYLSGALYSGNVEIGVVRINENLFGKLPPKAQAVVFQTKNGGERMLPLLEWSIAELNVPVYPETRVFRAVAAKVCQLADDKNQIELIVKQRPDILDGDYQVARMNCFQLEKPY